MCHRPTKEETERSDAIRAATASEEPRRDPWRFPEPRGNQDQDDHEVDKGRDKLEAVLGH